MGINFEPHPIGRRNCSELRETGLASRPSRHCPLLALEPTNSGSHMCSHAHTHRCTDRHTEINTETQHAHLAISTPQWSKLRVRVGGIVRSDLFWSAPTLAGASPMAHMAPGLHSPHQGGLDRLWAPSGRPWLGWGQAPPGPQTPVTAPEASAGWPAACSVAYPSPSIPVSVSSPFSYPRTPSSPGTQQDGQESGQSRPLHHGLDGAPLTSWAQVLLLELWV